MEIMDSGEPFLQWDKNLSELSEPGENDILYSTVSESSYNAVASLPSSLTPS